MKVAIAALDYRAGQMGGIETYLKDLLKGLERYGTKDRYALCTTPENSQTLRTGNRIEKLVIQRTLVHKIAKRMGFKSVSEVGRIEKWQPDVIHYPLQVMSPVELNAKIVVSSMDIQHEYYPEFFSQPELEARARTFRPSLERADRVIAISQFTKDSLVEKYKLPSEKIEVVHLAYDEDLYTRTYSSHSLQLPGKYLYYPAATWPHKNHARLISAYARFARNFPDIYLVFSGISKGQQQLLHTQIKQLGLSDKIIFMGYLDRRQLPELYHRAVALVFPSLFEGFGIPLLEAMACGCPVVAANTTSIPEVAGDAAIYFDSTDENDIQRAIERIARDKRLRISLQQHGFKNIQRFSIEKMTQATIEVYHRAAHG